VGKKRRADSFFALCPVIANPQGEAIQVAVHWIASPYGFAMTEHNDGIKQLQIKNNDLQ
jgi:hypothetical protein